MRRNVSAPTVSVVVPAKNEAANLRQVLPRLPVVHEVILVDGQSVDDTPAVAQRVMPAIRVVQQTRKGKGNALACGFAAATGDILVMFDADGSADPAEIPHFVATLVNGADFAKGSRYARGGGSEDITMLRSWGNAGLNFVANKAFGTKFTDLCYGYNAFWRDLLPVLDLPPAVAVCPAGGMMWGDGFEIETVINCRMAAAPVRIQEVPSLERSRVHGESNLRTFTDGARACCGQFWRSAAGGAAFQEPPHPTHHINRQSRHLISVDSVPLLAVHRPSLPLRAASLVRREASRKWVRSAGVLVSAR